MSSEEQNDNKTDYTIGEAREIFEDLMRRPSDSDDELSPNYLERDNEGGYYGAIIDSAWKGFKLAIAHFGIKK